MANTGDYLGDLTWPEARDRLADANAVVLPIAAGAKQHGRHLPLNTDQRVMEALLEDLVASRDVVVAPAVLHGWFPGFSGYPGTGIETAAVFQSYVMEIAQSLLKHSIQRLLILNLGIGRATGLPLGIVARELRSYHKLAVLVVSWEDLESEAVAEFSDQLRGGHADEMETSIMLALHGDRVDMTQAVMDYRQAAEPQIGYRPGSFEFDPTSPDSGVYGDPRLASVDKGERLLAIMKDRLRTALDQFVTAAS